MKKWILLLLPFLMSCSIEPNNQTKKLYNLDSFEFSIIWDLSRSSYDSKTGELVKSRDYRERKPEDFITNYNLLTDEREKILSKAIEIDVCSYDEKYNPYLEDNNTSWLVEPSAGLVYEDSYTRIEIPFYTNNKRYNPTNEKGKALVEYFQLIIDIVINTGEWKSLPDYEVFYY